MPSSSNIDRASINLDGIDDVVKIPPYQEGIDDLNMVIDMQPESDMPDIKVGMMQG